MTVAIVAKVRDGIAIAADSALCRQDADGVVTHLHLNAFKVFHLHDELPLAAAFWGTADMQGISIKTLVDVFRAHLMGQVGDARPEIQPFDPTSYTVEAVANRLVDILWDLLWVPSFKDHDFDADYRGTGFVVAGYSSGSCRPEVWQFGLDDVEHRPLVDEVLTGEFGYRAYAQNSAIERLFDGVDNGAKGHLIRALRPKYELAQAAFEPIKIEPLNADSSLDDAIDLARFMADVSVGYYRFKGGPVTVGGPVDVAALSNDGFRWIHRKPLDRTSGPLPTV